MLSQLLQWSFLALLRSKISAPNFDYPNQMRITQGPTISPKCRPSVLQALWSLPNTNEALAPRAKDHESPGTKRPSPREDPSSAAPGWLSDSVVSSAISQ